MFYNITPNNQLIVNNSNFETMSRKQNLIKQYLSKVDKATLSDIMDNMPFDYHHNNLKHLGSIISNMFKKGLVIRIKKGVFRLPNESDYKPKDNTLF